jgi:hypothetical protein
VARAGNTDPTTWPFSLRKVGYAVRDALLLLGLVRLLHDFGPAIGLEWAYGNKDYAIAGFVVGLDYFLWRGGLSDVLARTRRP